MKPVAVILTNYNMPERTDALCDHICKYADWPFELIVVDNGSDLVEPSQFTTLRLVENRQTTGGWLAGLSHADEIASRRGVEFYAYWFLITSAAFNSGQCTDPLTPLVNVLLNDPVAVGVHPALAPDSTTAWDHLKWRGGDSPRQTWMIDNIASLYRAEWFDSIGRFDPSMEFGWGVDLETCWKARVERRSLWIHEGLQVEKITDIGYTMGRMNMSADERRSLSSANMRAVLSGRYGAGWWQLMTSQGVSSEMA